MSDKKISDLDVLLPENYDYDNDYALAIRYGVGNYRVSIGDIINEAKAAIPTEVSQLNNDAEYVTKPELEDKGYISEHQDISHLATKAEVPTKVSQLINDRLFLDKIPSEYITSSELEDKGYLTEHQDISHLASREEIPTLVSESKEEIGFITEIPEEYAKKTDVDSAIKEAQFGIENIDFNSFVKKDDDNMKEVFDWFDENKEYINNENLSEYITDAELDEKNYATETYVREQIEDLAANGEKLNYSDVAPNAPGVGHPGVEESIARGDHTHPAQINIIGNASTAAKLQTSRSINGTKFDGLSDITTARWGTSRTITIGNSGKSINGSMNMSWTLSEIGAAPATHIHAEYAEAEALEQAISEIEALKEIVNKQQELINQLLDK